MKGKTLLLEEHFVQQFGQTRRGSGKHPPSPASEEAPANSPSFSPDTELNLDLPFKTCENRP